jgi:hypothetical protein
MGPLSTPVPTFKGLPAKLWPSDRVGCSRCIDLCLENPGISELAILCPVTARPCWAERIPVAATFKLEKLAKKIATSLV